MTILFFFISNWSGTVRKLLHNIVFALGFIFFFTFSRQDQHKVTTMQVKGVIIALLGISAITEAAVVQKRHPLARALQRRQFGGGRFGGGGRGGGGGGGNNGGQGGNNGGQNNGQANNGGNNNGGNNGGGGGGNTLDANAVQTGSQQDGNNPGSDEQAASAT